MYYSRKYSIFLPFFSLRTSKLILSIVLVLIGILPWVLPSDFSSGGVEEWLFRKAVECFADVGSMARISHHPFTIAICYSGAMVLGVVAGIVYALTEFPDYPFQKIDTASRWRRIGLMIFALAIIALPIFNELPVSQGRRTYGFFQHVSESRFYIFIWAISMMVMTAMSWVVVFLEISRFSSRFGRER